jgi:hypothetical protein
MKRYQHLILTSGYVTIATTDSNTAETIIPQVEQFLGGRIQVTQNDYLYTLKQLRNRDYTVYVWITSWLCMNGWEPYAVAGNVHGGSGSTSTSLQHYFRNEIQEPAPA